MNYDERQAMYGGITIGVIIGLIVGYLMTMITYETQPMESKHIIVPTYKIISDGVSQTDTTYIYNFQKQK